MTQPETQQNEVSQYIKDHWDWILNKYQKKHWGELLGEVDYILQQLGIVVSKKPEIYSFKKEETFNRTILYANMYFRKWKVYLKITDRGEVEYEVTK